MRSVWKPTSTSQVVTRPGRSREVWLSAAPTRSTNSPTRTTWTRMWTLALDTDAGHWTADADTRHPDAGRADSVRRAPGTPDRYRTPDTRRADADGRTRAGRQGMLSIRTSWDHDTAGTPNRAAVAAAHAAFGNHDGSAVRLPASARLLAALPAAAGSLRRRPSGASAYCSWLGGRAVGRRSRWQGLIAVHGLASTWCCWEESAPILSEFEGWREAALEVSVAPRKPSGSLLVDAARLDCSRMPGRRPGNGSDCRKRGFDHSIPFGRVCGSSANVGIGYVVRGATSDGWPARWRDVTAARTRIRASDAYALFTPRRPPSSRSKHGSASQ
jgi:hypothetical protein